MKNYIYLGGHNYKVVNLLKLKVMPIGTAIGALGGAAIGYALARRANISFQDASEMLRTITYVSGVSSFAGLGGCVGYATDKIREIKKYGKNTAQ